MWVSPAACHLQHTALGQNFCFYFPLPSLAEEKALEYRLDSVGGYSITLRTPRLYLC